MNKPIVAVILGSDSDLPAMSDTLKTIEEFNIPYELTFSSAHRSPELTIENVDRFYKEGIKVIIAAAGLAAHLAGVIAAHFPLPVIGVPMKGGAVNGVDSLYSTVQMPPGIPVATVGIDGAKNAALFPGGNGIQNIRKFIHSGGCQHNKQIHIRLAPDIRTAGSAAVKDQRNQFPAEHF